MSLDVGEVDRFVATGVVVVGLGAVVGCTGEPPCGEGTVESDGVCIGEHLVDGGDGAADAGGDTVAPETGGADTAVDTDSPPEDTEAGDVSDGGGDAGTADGDAGKTDGGGMEYPAGATLGGGGAYIAELRSEDEETFCEPPADANVVESLSELTSGLAGAGSGDVVYVPGDVDINLEAGGGVAEKIRIPSGVTLASDRGCDGSDGGRIYFESEQYDPWPTFIAEDGARILGVFFEGIRRAPYDPGEEHVSGGVRFVGGQGEIANCEFFGWGHFAIQAQNGTQLHVHHSDIHHQTVGSTGYGISVNGGSEALIEFNRFNYNRHSVASDGNASYTIRYNHFGPDTLDHVIDAHRPGGHTLEVHHNTVEAVRCMSHPEDVSVGGCPPEGGPTEAVTIRGTPSDRAWIHHNWFYNPREPGDTPSGYSGEAIAQQHTSEWQNVDWADNHYGESEPDSCNIGAPREGCPAP